MINMNEYKFVEGDHKTIYKVNSPERVIPEKDQLVIVKNKEYSVDKVSEIINYDSFTRKITIYLNNLE